MGVMAIFQVINTLMLIAVIAGFVLFIIVLLKLNKALDIWLEQNKKNQTLKIEED